MDLLSFGVPYTLLTNVAYALPIVKATIFTDAATPTIVQSNTSAFTASAAVTLVGGQATLAARFLKVTSANALVILARD